MSTTLFKTGTQVVHRQDPGWTWRVLYQLGSDVRVRRTTPHGWIEDTFQSDEIEPVESQAESEKAA